MRDGRALSLFLASVALLGAGCAPRSSRDAISRLRADQVDPDLDELRKTDPKLVVAMLVGTIKTGFAVTRGIALAPAGLCVAGDREIRVFSPDGRLKATVPVGSEPQCVAADSDGRLYVGLEDAVEAFGGTRPVAWQGLGPHSLVTSIAVSQDAVWVGDSGNREVLRFSRTGELVGRFGSRDPATKYPGLILPSPYLDVVVAPDGNLLVNNPGTHRVEKHTTAGKMIGAWGKEGPEIERFSGCCNPTNIAAMPDGCVVTSEKGLPRVKLYAADGRFLGVIAGADTFNENSTGLDLAVSGTRIYVLDPFAKAVRVYQLKPGVKR